MECKNCGKEIKGRARIYCNGNCYVKYYFSQPVNRKKNANWSYIWKIRKNFGITKEQYKNITKVCGVKDCGWKQNIEIHYIDSDRNNNDVANFYPLCANHHRLLHAGKLDLLSLISVEELENCRIKTLKEERTILLKEMNLIKNKISENDKEIVKLNINLEDL